VSLNQWLAEFSSSTKRSSIDLYIQTYQACSITSGLPVNRPQAAATQWGVSDSKFKEKDLLPTFFLHSIRNSTNRRFPSRSDLDRPYFQKVILGRTDRECREPLQNWMK